MKIATKNALENYEQLLTKVIEQGSPYLSVGDKKEAKMNMEQKLSLPSRLNTYLGGRKPREESGFKPNVAELRKVIDEIIALLKGENKSPIRDKDIAQNISRIRKNNL